MANKISVIIDVAVDKGVASLKNFRTAISEADGAAGKMKAGFGAAKDAIVDNAANIALSAGTALVAFGVKAVTAFQDVALAAGKFSDATGIAVEDASRWIEVAGDIGVSSDEVEAALGKMNKTLGASPALFTKLGVEVAKTKDGNTDANQTFLNVIDRLNGITDPAEKARVATQLLGKGWQGMAELIAQGSGKLKESLASVSEGQVIDSGEVGKARNLRSAMDDLGDAFKNAGLQLGELVASLGPAIKRIASFAETVLGLASKAAEVTFGTNEMATAFKKFAEQAKDPTLWEQRLRDLTNATVDAKGGLDALKELGKDIFTGTTIAGDRWDNLVEAFHQLQQLSPEMAKQLVDDLDMVVTSSEAGDNAASDFAHSIAVTRDKVTDLRGELDSFVPKTTDTGNALSDAAEQTKEFGDAVKDAQTELKSYYDALANEQAFSDLLSSLGEMQAKLQDTSVSATDQASNLNEAKRAVINYAKQVGDIPLSRVTEILAILNTGNYKAAADALERLAAPRKATFEIQVSTTLIGNQRVGAGLRNEMEGRTAGKSAADAFSSGFAKGIADANKSSGRGGGGGSTVRTPAEVMADWDKVFANLYKLGEWDLETYRSQLQHRLGEYAKYSDDYMRVYDVLQQLMVDEAAKEKQKAEDAAKAKADEVAQEQAKVDAMYELGEISRADYRAQLQDRLRSTEKYSSDYMRIVKEIAGLDKEVAAEQKAAADEAAKAEQDRLAAEQKASEDAKRAAEDRLAAEQKASEDAKRAAEEAQRAQDDALNRAAMQSIVAANIGGATYATINTAADPNAVINAIQQYERRNGPGWRA